LQIECELDVLELRV